MVYQGLKKGVSLIVWVLREKGTYHVLEEHQRGAKGAKSTRKKSDTVRGQKG